MLVNHETQHVFLHNPKCGGTSVTEHLLSQGFVYLRDPHMHNADGVLNRHSWDVPTELKKYHTFCTVRHPYEFCLSHWRYSTDYDLLVHPMSFIEWIETYAPAIPHQSRYTQISQTVIRIEQIYHSSLPFTLRDIPHLNQSSSRSFNSELTPETRRLIYCIFRDDFNFIGYRP